MHSLAMNEDVSAIIYRHLCACIKINITKEKFKYHISANQHSTAVDVVANALLTQYSLPKANSTNKQGASVPDK